MRARRGLGHDRDMLPIVFQDEHLVVIDKPPGLLVHRSEIDRGETRFAVQLLRDQLGRRVSPVHRLDRGTSGLLVFSFEAEVTARLAAQFAERGVAKRYLAVVRGTPPEEPQPRMVARSAIRRLSRRGPHGERGGRNWPRSGGRTRPR